MKATLIIAGLFAVAGFCSPIDDKKKDGKGLKSSKSGEKSTAKFTNLKIKDTDLLADDLWDGDNHLGEEISKKVKDITEKKFHKEVKAACEQNTECEGFYINTAKNDGPEENSTRFRFGYLFKSTATKDDFKPKPKDSSWPYDDIKDAKAYVKEEKDCDSETGSC